MTSTSPVAAGQNNFAPQSDSNQPLTSNEIASLRKYLGDEDAAGADDIDLPFLTGKNNEELVRELGGPSKARIIIDIMSGERTLSAEELSQSLGIPSFLKKLGFPNQDPVEFTRNVFLGGTSSTAEMRTRYSSSAVLAPLLKLAAVSYASGIDLEGVAVEMIDNKLQLSYEMADQTFQGAITNFVLNMVAAGITLAGGATTLGLSVKNRNVDGYQPSQWFGPVGAQLFGQPLGQAGDYVQARATRDATETDADKQEVDDLLQMLKQLIQSLQSNVVR